MKTTTMKGRKLKQLIFERDDYYARYFKLVKRVKEQLKEIQRLTARLTIAESTVANDSLAVLLIKQKNERLQSYCNLNRPDVLKLLKAVERQEAKAQANVLKPINVTIKTRRFAPRIDGV